MKMFFKCWNVKKPMDQCNLLPIVDPTGNPPEQHSKWSKHLRTGGSLGGGSQIIQIIFGPHLVFINNNKVTRYWGCQTSYMRHRLLFPMIITWACTIDRQGIQFTNLQPAVEGTREYFPRALCDIYPLHAPPLLRYVMITWLYLNRSHHHLHLDHWLSMWQPESPEPKSPEYKMKRYIFIYNGLKDQNRNIG